MSFALLHKTARLLVATLILSVAIIAKVPTTHCHCRDAKATSQQKSECPFGKLRGLLGTFSIVSNPLPVTEFVELIGIVPSAYQAQFTTRRYLDAQARAPPAVAFLS